MKLTDRIGQWSTKQKAIAAAIAVVVVGGGVAGLTVALSGGSSKTKALPSSTPSTPTATPTPTSAPAPVNPLTGLGAPPTGPVIGVKIDDTANGRPQVGLDKADIVYVEQAEGGLTRLLAVFATNKPTVEAVRSVRASDPELLSQYGRIILVASGGSGDSLPTLDKSILHGVIMDRGGPGFSRDGSRSAPYNVMSNLAAVSSAVKADSAKSIGLQWASTSPGLPASRKATSLRTQVGGTPVEFQWDAKLKRYARVIEGVRQNAADGAPIATPNVIVQFCQVTVNPGDVDVEGNPSQYTHSIGHARVAVLRNGHRIDGS
ncbi:MAG TPA: DUF3048 domain-containing protein [Jatrophihabitantaceae bacterium]|nr:DUF3048 domain-containing protein [Jatrophihabitantaceae bacterium]